LGESPNDVKPGEVLPKTDYDLIRWHGHAAVITVLISTLFGILVATKFNFPSFMGGHAWETWGRLRYNHTQGIFFGWLGNAFIAFCYYVVPRLTKQPVTSRKLGMAIFWIWNFAVVVPGWALVCMGFSQPLEWAEFPIVVDVFVVLALVLMLIQFVKPFLRVPAGELYVSGWYVIGGLIFTTFAYPIGNLVPELVAGAKGAAFSGLWIHDAVGLYVTPLAVAMAYYVIPAETRRPIYSHFLSMLGFWLLFFIYPLNGTHHYVYSAIPMSAQRGAIIASVFLGFDVILVVTNLLLSLRGSSGKVGGSVALRFTWFGVVVYLVVSLQGSVQAVMPVNRMIHFSDWVIGHSHLAMIGFASFTAAGALAHIWRRIPGARYSERAMNWSFWLLTLGLMLMVADLTTAGLIEGQMWVTRAPWMDSVRTMYPYWLTRDVSGLPIIAGFLLFWVGLSAGPRNELRVKTQRSALQTEVSLGDDDPGERSGLRREPSILSYAYVVAFVAGFGFFLLSFVVLGIIPAMQLQAEINRTAPHDMQPLSASEQRGRIIYGREGCAYCHTEQVRSIDADVRRFGAPTAAWETQYDYPQLWGTRRIGPDLAREYDLRTDDWHYTHLFNPRSTVPDSIMPGFPWLFQGSAAHPTGEASDLVAYVRSIGKDRALAGAVQIVRSPGMEMDGDDGSQGVPETRPRPTMMGLDPAAVLLASAESPDPAHVVRGRTVFLHNCSGCHGENADGAGTAAGSLLPKPVNLHTLHLSSESLAAVLWDGVYGTSMPAWRELQKDDLEDVTAYVQSLQAKRVGDALSNANLVAAKQVYAAHCVSCHGGSGRGDGPAAGALRPSPINFHVNQPSTAYGLTVVNLGIPGSAMPGWKNNLPPDQIQSLVRYIQMMYGNDKEPTSP
jgi:cytochrome c oxidase cbb3-type subunit I/II